MELLTGSIGTVMSRPPPPTPGSTSSFLAPAIAGAVGGALAMMGGALLVLTSLVADGAEARGSLVIGVASMILGMLLTRIDWGRHPPTTVLVILVPAVVALGAQNLVHPDPYLAGLQYPLVAMWVGMSQRRGIPTLVAPGLAAGYALPLALVAPSPSLLVATPSMAVLCAAAGETVAHLADQLRRAHERDRERRERRYEALLAQSSDVTALVDEAGRLVYLSQSADRMLGPGARERLLTTPPPDDGAVVTAPGGTPPLMEVLVHPDDLPSVRLAISRLAVEPHRAATFRLRLLRSDRTWIHVEAAGRNLLADADVGGFLFAIRDISRRRALERELERRATHDELTGLLNRWGLFEELERSVSGDDGRVALLFCDLDRFKDVNDELGHRAGDTVLREMAHRLRLTVSEERPAARLGGDEFGVLLRGDDADEERAVAVAERVVGRLTAPIEVEGHEVVVPVSIGVALASGDQVRPKLERLLVDADLAMYEAKSRTEDGAVTVYHDALRHDLLERTQLHRELRDALDGEQIVAHYQPLVLLADGRPVALETLARWHHPRRGLLPPKLFIGLAERSGLVTRLNEQMLGLACAELARLRQRSPLFDGIYVSVNIASSQLGTDRFMTRLTTEIAANGLRPRDLCLEVTEGEPLESSEAIDQMERLRRIGFRLAVDDFGTGYSSLRYLHQLPLDVIKIDKGFVDVIDQPESRALIRSIVEIARNLSLTTVAEGVEHPDQALALEELGVAVGQGYLWARAVPPEELPATLSRLAVPLPSRAVQIGARDRPVAP